MNLFKALLLSSLFIFFTSCASLSGADKSCCTKADHSCCTESPDCTQGNCKIDKSCCADACGNCDGKKGDCGKSCKLKSKKTAKSDSCKLKSKNCKSHKS